MKVYKINKDKIDLKENLLKESSENGVVSESVKNEKVDNSFKNHLKIKEYLHKVDIKTVKNSTKKKLKFGWPIKIFILTLSLSLMFSVLSEMILTNAGFVISIFVIIVLLFISSFFDTLGVAVSACNVDVFSAEEYREVRGILQAKFLTKHADKVASFCCDIIGDTCGILSGSAGAAIALKLISEIDGAFGFCISVFITSLITGLTVFCKALGKNFAINKSATIIFSIGKMLSVFSFGRKKKK